MIAFGINRANMQFIITMDDCTALTVNKPEPAYDDLRWRHREVLSEEKVSDSIPMMQKIGQNTWINANYCSLVGKEAAV